MDANECLVMLVKRVSTIEAGLASIDTRLQNITKLLSRLLALESTAHDGIAMAISQVHMSKQEAQAQLAQAFVEFSQKEAKEFSAMEMQAYEKAMAHLDKLGVPREKPKQ